jgi:hypothetical protein
MLVRQLIAYDSKQALVQPGLRMIIQQLDWNDQEQQPGVNVFKITKAVHDVLTDGINQHSQRRERNNVNGQFPVLPEPV